VNGRWKQFSKFFGEVLVSFPLMIIPRFHIQTPIYIYYKCKR
jgi:hypothetical protein